MKAIRVTIIWILVTSNAAMLLENIQYLIATITIVFPVVHVFQWCMINFITCMYHYINH